MKVFLLQLFLVFGVLSTLNAKEYKLFTGEVTEYKKGATRLYQVRGLTVARGGERYVRKYVGQVVKLLCLIKANKIVRIKSVEHLGKSRDKSQFMTLQELRRMYKSNRSSTIEKYRNRELRIRSAITSISVKNAQQYQISLEGSQGRILIDKFELDADLRKRLFALNEVRNGRKGVTFVGKWFGNQGDILLFREIRKIK